MQRQKSELLSTSNFELQEPLYIRSNPERFKRNGTQRDLRDYLSQPLPYKSIAFSLESSIIASIRLLYNSPLRKRGLWFPLITTTRFCRSRTSQCLGITWLYTRGQKNFFNLERSTPPRS